MKKLVVLQPVLAHYRESVFNIMENWEDYDISFIAGSEYQGISTMQSDKSILHSYFHFSLLNHKFYFLKGCVRSMKKLKPDIIISSGVDPHLLHTLIVFFYFRIFRGIDFFWWSHGTPGNQGGVGFFLRRFFYRNASGVFTYNDKGKTTLENWGIKKKNIRVIRNSLNQEDYGYLNHDIYRITNSELFTIVFSGRVNEYKRLNVLIEALALLKRTENLAVLLYIIGNGDLVSLNEQVKKEGLEKDIVFTGQQYGDGAAKYLLQSDLMVYPRYIGLSIVHAFSFGIPVITSNKLKYQGPEIELMIPGVTGDFYEEDNIDDLAQKISIWKTKIVSERENIQKSCIQRIIDLEYLPQSVAKKIHNFLFENT